MEKKWLEAGEEGIQAISEEIWKNAAGPKRSLKKFLVLFVKTGVVLEILLFILALLTIILLLVAGQNDIYWGVIIGPACSVMAFQTLLSLLDEEKSAYSYLLLRKTVKKWIKRMKYKTALTEEGIWVSVCGRTMHWKWDQITWYHCYGQVAILGIENYCIFLEVFRLDSEEKKQYHQILSEKAGQRAMPELYFRSFMKGLKRLYLYAKKMKNN